MKIQTKQNKSDFEEAGFACQIGQEGNRFWRKSQKKSGAQFSRPIFRAFFIAFLFVIFSTELSAATKKLPVKTLSIIKADGSTLPVDCEIAKKPDDRARGFMGRKKIPDGTGMIFVFEQDQILSFWMKNTPHPLSIAYIDSAGKIRDIFDMQPFSLASVQSTSSVRYALEVPQGWFRKNGVSVGDTVTLSF